VVEFWLALAAAAIVGGRWSAALDPVPLAASPRSTPMTPTDAASHRTPRAGGVRHQATRPVCRRPNRAIWAGSPAACWPTGLRPNAPTPWPSSWAGVNAAAAELGTTWPSLRKAFTRHGLGMPARNPEAVRQRAIAAAYQRSGQPATPTLDPVFVTLNPGALPARPRSPAELYQWVRRDEEYATLGADVIIELYSESNARKPTTRA
jgi:hypothetical protein